MSAPDGTSVGAPQAAEALRPPTTSAASLTPRVAEVVRLYRAGWTRGGVAEHMGVTPHTVSRFASIARRAGVHLPSAPQPSRAKINPYRVVAMRNAGKSLAEIAAHFGCHAPSVSAILNRMARAGATVHSLGRWHGRPKTEDIFARAVLVGVKVAAAEFGMTAKALDERFYKARLSLRVARRAAGLPLMPSRNSASPPAAGTVQRGDAASVPAVPVDATGDDTAAVRFRVLDVSPGNNLRAAAGGAAHFHRG